MNPNPNPQRLQHQQKKEESQETQASLNTTAHEFASVEEMLRSDATATPVPPAVEQRLVASIMKEGASAPRPWWKRWFGGST